MASTTNPSQPAVGFFGQVDQDAQTPKREDNVTSLIIPYQGTSVRTHDAEYIIQNKTSSAVRNLGEHLASDFLTEKGDDRTNLINMHGGKSYALPSEKLPEFFSLYDKCRKEGRLLHYAERQFTQDDRLTHSGLVIDLKAYHVSSVRTLLTAQINVCIEILCNVLTNTLVIDGEDMFHVFVFRRKNVVKGTGSKAHLHKDNLRLLVPDIHITKACKTHIMRKLTTFLQDKRSGLGDISILPGSDVSPVYLAGGCKVGSAPLELCFVTEVTISLFGRFNTNTLDHEAIARGEHKEDGNLRPINLSYEISPVHVLPEVDGKPVWLKKWRPSVRPGIDLPSETLPSPDPQRTSTSCEKQVAILIANNADAAYIKRLLDLLEPSFYEDHDAWWRVLCAIAHASSHYRLLADWFSQKSEKYTPQGFEIAWAAAIRRHSEPVTVNSLEHWAQKCAPTKYQSIKDEHYLCILATHCYENMGCIEHAANADVLVAMLPGKFVTDDSGMAIRGQEHGWWEFVTENQKMCFGEVFKYRHEPKPDNLFLFIANNLPKVYAALLERIEKRKESTTDENTLKYLEACRKNLFKYKIKLGITAFQGGIVTQCALRFRERGFARALDDYKYVIGVAQGILKIGRTTELITGYHGYRISKYTDTEYVPWNENCIYQRRLLSAFHDIFPEDDVFEFMMCWSATNLDGCLSSNILTLLIGGGSNGKSFFLKMNHNSVGDQYAASGKAQLLTSPSERASDANSAQMHMKGKHCFYFEEFSKSEILNDAKLKSLVGQGKQSCRDLYSKQENFQTTCDPIAASNFELGILTADHGTWRRLRYYRHKVMFTDKPDPDNPFEKKADPTMMREMPDDPKYRSAMLAIQTHYYELYQRKYKGVLENIPCATMARELEAFRNSQDILNRFIVSYIVVSPKAGEIHIDVIAQKYADWSKQRCGRPIGCKDAESQIENSRLGKYLKFNGSIKWLTGHRIKSAPEELLKDGEIPIYEAEGLLLTVPGEKQGTTKEVPPTASYYDNPPPELPVIKEDLA